MKKGILMFFFFISFTFLYSQNVIFLHHSTGAGVYNEGDVAGWIENYNSVNGTDYQISERSYPTTPYPWENYPYDYWNLWINGACDNANPNIECMDKITSEYDVIIYKHCYPGAAIALEKETTSVDSDDKTLGNYKLQYRALLSLMDQYPRNKFIIWTLVPLHRLSTYPEQAARAREFVDWVKNSWLTEDGQQHPNVYIFDFFGLAAESDPSPENGMVNCLKYEYEYSHTSYNSHPNSLANQTIGPIFAQFIVNTIEENSETEDELPPSAPSGLQVTSSTVSSVSLAWNASSDNVGVTSYKVYRDGIPVGTSSDLRHTDNSVAPENTYSYSISALDAAGNESVRSGPVDADTHDSQSPSVPTGLKIISASATEVKLEWNASSDNVGVTSYRIYRNGSLVGTSTDLQHTDTSVAPESSYSYSISALDAAGNESERSGSVDADTHDSQSPSVPTGLKITSASATEVTLEWNASSDNIGVTSYRIYRDGSPVGTSTDLRHTDTSLAPESSYSYSISALDAAGNESERSGSVDADTHDSQSPSVPTGLKIISASATEVMLEWNASSDNVGVTSYRIYRDGSPVGTSSDLRHTDNSVAPENTYLYSISALDAAGNESERSGTVSANTHDSELPSTPKGLQITAVSATEVTLEWNASSDNIGVTSYKIYRNGSPVGTSSILRYTDASVAPENTYSYSISALDAAGNESERSGTVSANTHDSEPPSTPEGLQITAASATEVTLEWNAASDNIGVTSYRIYRNGNHVGMSSILSYTDASIAPENIYSYSISALDAAGNESERSGTVSANTHDSEPPSTPEGLQITAASATEVTLEWNAASDNIGVTSYRIYRNGSHVGTSSILRYTDASVEPENTYSYSISALDAAGNESERSGTVSANTHDSEPPSTPEGLQITAASATEVTLEWNASSDNVGATSYKIYRNGSPVGTSSILSYTDVSIAPENKYSYSISALDAAGNESERSGTVSANTHDSEPPSTPEGLQITAASATEVTLEWNASSDNVGVTSYRIYRNGSPVGTSSILSYTDASIAPENTYSYSISALDAAGNESERTGTASANTHDSEPPSTPQGLQVIAASATEVSLSWNAAIDNIGVNVYNIYRNEDLINSVQKLTCTDRSIDPENIYSYSVSAVDAAGNESPLSDSVNANTHDNESPSPPTGLRIISASANEVSLAWDSAFDNVAVITYNIYRDMKIIGSTSGVYHYDNTAEPGNSFIYSVSACDRAGNESSLSEQVIASTNDTEPPSAPTDLQVKNISSNSVELGWNPSTDNIGVSGYHMYRNDFLVGFTESNSYSDDAVISGKNYVYKVSAFDATGNESPYSDTVSTNILISGLESDQEFYGFKIYPNPTKAEFKVIVNEENGFYLFEIISTTGSMIYKSKVDLYNHEFTVPDLNLKTGIYIISLVGKKKKYSEILHIME